MCPNESEGSSMLKSKNIKWRNTRLPIILYSWWTLLFTSSVHYTIIHYTYYISIHIYFMHIKDICRLLYTICTIHQKLHIWHIYHLLFITWIATINTRSLDPLTPSFSIEDSFLTERANGGNETSNTKDWPSN